MTQQFKIAMVAACPFPYPRGTPVRIFRMAEALSKRGHDVHVITYHLRDESTAVPFKIHRIPEIKTYRDYAPGPTYQKLLLLDPLLTIWLLKVLRKHSIDLIHAHHYEGLLISLLARKWTHHPVVFDAHTLLGSELPVYGLGLSQRAKRWIARSFDWRLPRRASHIIAVTEDIRIKLIEEHGLAPEAITVVTNGVEAEHFGLNGMQAPLPRPETKTLIFTGNLAAYQGIDLMLKAFRVLLDKRQDVRLLLVTDASFDEYEALAHALRIRHHIDIVPSCFETLPQYLAGADIALNPRTDCDGIPQKLLNYMAAGKPVVSFAGSAKNLRHGELGMVVNDGDVGAFGETIALLLDNVPLARTLGENAKRYIRAEFTWSRVAERTETVYRDVLDRTSGRNFNKTAC